ncbi:MAG: hypothetical protein JWO13_431 [Acidobacteriales bacterium]|nr:hypothetical protein [Terriglobales bacterium]
MNGQIQTQLGDIRAKDLGPAIALLRSFGIDPRRIARLFETTPENIRQIDYRAQHPRAAEAPLSVTPAREVPQPYEVPIYGKERVRLDELGHRIETTARQYAAAYQFSEGLAALRQCLAPLSTPTNSYKLRLKARLHHQIAWFALHQGLSSTALSNAAFSQQLSTEAYRKSWNKVDLAGFIDTALILALALLLSNEGSRTQRELHALKILDLAKEVAEGANLPRGSEHFRQRGTLLFRLGQDEEAKINFRTAMEAMRRMGEARDETHVLMVGTRLLNLAEKTPNWEASNELLTKCEATFGRESLEYVMNCNATAACGLLTDSVPVHVEALDLLNSTVKSKQFGHQATVTKLLSITPDLKLLAWDRSRWIRFALHTNAFRNR